MSNLFGAPMDHGPLSVQTGFDELGRPIYRTPLGSIVGEAIPEPPRQNALASILRTEVDPFTGRAIHRREDLQPTRTGNALAALLQGVTQGLTAPGRAARGQPVTLGDVWATALESGAMAAPMPAPRGAIRAGAMGTEGPADEIARMLREGRASEITDDMMARLSPEDNVRLFRLYEEGATGQPMPMDEASRMARAREMGFDPDTPLYHGTGANFPAFSPQMRGGVADAYSARRADWFSDSPTTAQGYADMAAREAPVARLIRASEAAERANDYRRADSLMRQAERLEASMPQEAGQNIIQTLTRRPDSAVDADFSGVNDMENSLRDLIDAAQRRGEVGVEVRNLNDHPDFSVEDFATHRGIFAPRNIRSRFARFDPRLSHLAHLSAGGAGVAVLGGQEDQGGWDRARQYLREIGALE